MAGGFMKEPGCSSLQMAQRAVGQRIRELREAKGWSQTTFAARCGLDPGYMSRIERGKTDVGCVVLQIMANKLEMSVFSLLENIV